MSPHEKLTEHFTLAEMTRTSVRLPNTPPAMYVDKLRALCNAILEPVRAHFAQPILVSSGYRSEAVNARVNGDPRSQHRKAEAADFEVDGSSNWTVGLWIAENVDFDQLIFEFIGHLDDAGTWIDDSSGRLGWIHCSYVGPARKGRRSIKIARFVKGADGRVKRQYETVAAADLSAIVTKVTHSSGRLAA